MVMNPYQVELSSTSQLCNLILLLRATPRKPSPVFRRPASSANHSYSRRATIGAMRAAMTSIPFLFG